MTRPFDIVRNLDQITLIGFGYQDMFDAATMCRQELFFNPPMRNTLPRKVTSPVMAISARMAMPVMAETMAVVGAIPADGPSLGLQPSGMWICKWYF